jgi:SAM-dependent methyltransferase
MTTIGGPEPGPISARVSHHARQMAESFGADADRYDRTRPRYPQAMVDRIIAASPGRDVLDVGIGTGVSAQPFDAAGCRVLGVDVDARMASFARERRGLQVEVAKFEDWDPAGRTFDLVIAGQAWHWIDPAAGAAKAASVLRPGGRLAVFWNVFQFPPGLGEAFSAVYRRVLPDSPYGGISGGANAYSGQLTKATDGIRETGAFAEPEQWQVDWQHHYSGDEWLEMVPTAGGFNTFPAEKQAEVLAGLGVAIDAAGGSFTMDYATIAVTAARR